MDRLRPIRQRAQRLFRLVWRSFVWYRRNTYGPFVKLDWLLFPGGVIAAIVFIPAIVHGWWGISTDQTSQLLLVDGAAALAFMTIFYVAHTKKLAEETINARHNALHPVLVYEKPAPGTIQYHKRIIGLYNAGPGVALNIQVHYAGQNGERIGHEMSLSPLGPGKQDRVDADALALDQSSLSQVTNMTIEYEDVFKNNHSTVIGGCLSQHTYADKGYWLFDPDGNLSHLCGSR